tara:strand:+ start:8569 stop:8958 length:390 start_codon:yes stop_codon:yes gene_type:complete
VNDAASLMCFTNGMSAGNTLYEAQVQRLSEIFERAVKKQIIQEEIALPDVPLHVLETHPKTCGVFASFGAHPTLEVALERSLTELMQGRSFEGLNDFLPPTTKEPQERRWTSRAGICHGRSMSDQPVGI